jgi:Beta-ketoacyl synthase, N-terminal domain/Beta-ketoacyl synthase, C-terminal domain
MLRLTWLCCTWQALSPVGRCRTFDAAADGYGRGDGCVAVVLKPAADCLETGDGDGSSGGGIALLQGSAVNQDGRSSSLTAPNGPSQSALVSAALDAAGAKHATLPGATVLILIPSAALIDVMTLSLVQLHDHLHSKIVAALMSSSPRQQPSRVGHSASSLSQQRLAC